MFIIVLVVFVVATIEWPSAAVNKILSSDGEERYDTSHAQYRSTGVGDRAYYYNKYVITFFFVGR